MNFRPLHDRVVVKRLEENEQKSGMIIIPDSAKEKPMQAKVMAVGNGVVQKDGGRRALDVKPGDTILLGKYSGSDVRLDGEDYVVLREDEILAIVG
jgi:chaperonin GroES